MSTEYGLYCLDCKEHDIIDGMRQGQYCLELIANADTLAALYVGFDGTNLEVEVKLLSYIRIDTSWFAKHKGHKFTIVDEYGSEWPRCHQKFMKDGQKFPNYCNLREGHADDHSELRPLAWY